MEQVHIEDEPFLISRNAASKRYGVSQRAFDEIYRRNPDFPIVHIGKRVMVHKDEADAWFTRNIREVIEVG